MISGIFSIIQLILKLIGLWEQFMDWSEKKRIADREDRRQQRDKAVDDAVKSQTEEEFNEAQDRISRNLPRP